MTNQAFSLIERPPTVSEHQALWNAVGWGDVNITISGPSLANSLYGVVILYEEAVVGMGRIIGDGAMYYYVQDVAILPEHQNKGLGKLIMDKLIHYIETHCAGDAFVGLFAAHGKEAFYERLGFANHAPDMTGMFQVLKK